MKYLWRIREKITPKTREALDGFGLVLAVTLFFCLLQAAHDDIVNRNRALDQEKWWYPIYRIVQPPEE